MTTKTDTFMAPSKELVQPDEIFYLNSEIAQNQTGSLPNREKLPEIAVTLTDKELTTTVLSLLKLKEFQHWVARIYQEKTPAPCQLQDTLVLPRFITVRSLKDLQDPEHPPINPNALIADTLSEITSLTIQKYLSARGKEDHEIAAYSQHASISLINLLLFLQKTGEGKVQWKSPRWETSTDGFQVFQDAIFTPNEIYTVYFTPGRNRLGIAWHSPNPHAPVPTDQEITICEMRIEAPLNRPTLDMDIHIRVGRSTRNDKSTYSKASFEDLFDRIFGPNRHHVMILIGNLNDRVNYIRNFMRRLGIEHIFKTTQDIPERVKITKQNFPIRDIGLLPRKHPRN